MAQLKHEVYCTDEALKFLQRLVNMCGWNFVVFKPLNELQKKENEHGSVQ